MGLSDWHDYRKGQTFRNHGIHAIRRITSRIIPVRPTRRTMELVRLDKAVLQTSGKLVRRVEIPGTMRQAKTELYVHIVWSTQRRARMITEVVRKDLYPVIVSEAQALGCVVLAIDGMEDHVHLCARMPARLSVADLVKQIKGVSSRFAGQKFQFDDVFRWQAGYGAFSLSRSHVKRVIRYIQNQRQHHEHGTAWPEWEETDKETDESQGE